MTKTSDLFDPGLLREMVEAKMVRRFEHDNGDLIGFDYTHLAQWERCWNDVTLQCRGLLATTDGTIVARPFPKFFNLGERPDEDSKRIGQPFTVAEKLDGSLGIHYRWNGQDHIATRGSFHSEQAQWATDHYRQHYSPDTQLDPNLTHLFEIIYPSNRIVVDYGDREALVLLGALAIATGDAVPILWPHEQRAVIYAIEQVGTPEALRDDWGHLDDGNFEGFVVTFADGYRIKVKLDEYVRLHRIMSSTSNRTIWEAARAGTRIDKLFESVPDEFYQWAEGVYDDLIDRFTWMEIEARDNARKSSHAPLPFAMLDGKSYADTIWKRLRPESLEYPPIGGAEGPDPYDVPEGER